ncbi:MAG: DUF58 domain-containing protein [Lachnospiraceae bacterium]
MGLVSDGRSNVKEFDVFIRVVLVTIGIVTAIVLFIFLLLFLYRILRRYALKNLEYKRYFTDKGAFEGQEIQLIEELTNHGFFPLLRVYVETHITTKLYMPGASGGNEINQEFISRFFVMPYTRIKRHHRVILKKRGHYRLESAKISFMGIEAYLDSEAEIRVYPKELHIDDIQRINQCIQVSALSNRPIIRDVFSFAKVREYTYGDSINIINHKSTARMGRLMVNDADFVLGRKILLCLNFQAGNTGIPEEKFAEIQEKSMQFAAYLAGEAIRKGWQIGLIANCKTDSGAKSVKVYMGTGYGKYIEILEALSMARTIYGNSIGRIIDEAADGNLRNTEVIIFSTYVDESIEKRVEMLMREGNEAAVIDLKEVTAYEA